MDWSVKNERFPTEISCAGLFHENDRVFTIVRLNLFQDEEEQTKKTRKKFSKKQLRAGHGVLTLQTGTNQFASQKGMSFGAIRHCADIRADDLLKDGEGELTLQAGTNRYATQKGMRIGSVRHCADIRADDAVPEGQGELGLQAGTNRYATQKGMTSFGAVRHVSDIKVTQLYDEGDDDEFPTDEEDEYVPPKSSKASKRGEPAPEPEPEEAADEEAE